MDKRRMNWGEGILKEDHRNGETGKAAILVTKRDPGKEAFGCYQLKVISHCFCWVPSESWGWKRETFLSNVFVMLYQFVNIWSKCSRVPLPHPPASNPRRQSSFHNILIITNTVVRLGNNKSYRP